jgi:2-(1,2-epoxy-1,2-dihydrophenyl)acetyl-CoA isomerase
MADDVLYDEPVDGVVLLTLNRPDSLNAMGGDLMPLLGRYLKECERSRDVRCVAVTGAGRAFCAGGDVKGMASRPAEGEASGTAERPPSLARSIEEGVAGLRRSQDDVSFMLFTMAKPTIALVNGPAAGAGMSVALSCDIRFCSDRARFIPAFAKVGLSGDYGGSWFLQRLIGYGRARELYFRSETVDADRALELGIANHVVPHDELLERGIEYCASLAKGPTAVYGRMKANFAFGAWSNLQDTLDQEALNMRMSGMANDFREGTRSFVEKRDPNFTGE